jgi:hypothetical protein
LEKNNKISNIKLNIDDLIKNCNTGDIIFYDIPRIIPNIFHYIPTLFFGIHHMGFVVKKNNTVYLLECAYDNNYCLYSNKIKNGVTLFDVKDRIVHSNNEIYFVKNNIYNFIKDSDVEIFLEKYKNMDYMENNVNCVSIYLMFLQDLNLIKDKYTLFPLYEEYEKLLQPEFYSFPYKKEIYKIIPVNI